MVQLQAVPAPPCRHLDTRNIEFVMHDHGWELRVNDQRVDYGRWNTVDDARSTLYALGIPFRVVNRMTED